MEFSAKVLLAEPVVIFGVLTLVVIVIALALTRSLRRVLVGVLGAVTGYVVLGTGLAYDFADDARSRGACPDAGWMGPSVGAFVGAIAFVIVYELVRGWRTGGKDASTQGTV